MSTHQRFTSPSVEIQNEVVSNARRWLFRRHRFATGEHEVASEAGH